MKRDHDHFYINENNKKIKDSFIAVADRIEPGFSGVIADVGCATGAFPNYLSSRFENSQVFGIEYLEPLLEKARQDFQHIRFVSGNVLDKNSVDDRFDVLTMLGVLCIFDNVNLVLSNALSWLKPKGRLILHNMINDYDIDVYVKYTPSSLAFEESALQSGWNIVSRKTLEFFCEQNNASIAYCEDFNISVDIPSNSTDPMRSWTEVTKENRRAIYNGLNIRQPQKIVVIEKND